MQRAVISGVNGVIGRALLDVLVSNGVEVLALVREGSPRNSDIPRHPAVRVENCSLEQMAHFGGQWGEYDAFFHLAWQGSFGAGRAQVAAQVQNIAFTLDAVALAERLGCGVFVGVGSQAEYGPVPWGQALTPSLPCQPQSAYGMAKLCAGQMSRVLCEQLGMRHVWARMLSVYGPHDGAGTLIMSAISHFWQGLCGEFTKAEQYWDYLFAEDAARALYHMAKKGKHGRAYVVGSGEGRVLREYILRLREIVNPSCELRFGALPYREHQPMYLCADLSELAADTGFLPQISFDEGVRRTLVWYRENKE